MKITGYELRNFSTGELETYSIWEQLEAKMFEYDLDGTQYQLYELIQSLRGERELFAGKPVEEEVKKRRKSKRSSFANATWEVLVGYTYLEYNTHKNKEKQNKELLSLIKPKQLNKPKYVLNLRKAVAEFKQIMFLNKAKLNIQFTEIKDEV